MGFRVMGHGFEVKGRVVAFCVCACVSVGIVAGFLEVWGGGETLNFGACCSSQVQIQKPQAQRTTGACLQKNAL